MFCRSSKEPFIRNSFLASWWHCVEQCQERCPFSWVWLIIDRAAPATICGKEAAWLQEHLQSLRISGAQLCTYPWDHRSWPGGFHHRYCKPRGVYKPFYDGLSCNSCDTVYRAYFKCEDLMMDMTRKTWLGSLSPRNVRIIALLWPRRRWFAKRISERERWQG